MIETDKINDYDDWISKSQKKRDSKKLNSFAEQIVLLRDNEFERIDFADLDFLKDELILARKFHKNSQFEPYRRQMLHIERLLRSCDEVSIDSLKKQLDFTISKNISTNAKFHRLEQLRDFLIETDNFMPIVNKLAYDNDQFDKNKIRQIIIKAKKNNEPNKQNFSTELFRYLRDHIQKDFDLKELTNA